MNVKKLKLAGLAAMLVLCAGKAWAVDFIDGSITVTPVATVSLNLPTTYYAFGNVGVNTATSSVTGLSLQNTGNANVTVSKKITDQSNPAGWTAQVSTGTIDQYTLYCAASASQFAIGSFGAGTKFGILNNSSSLTAADGVTNTSIAVAGNTPLWFRLDMPTSVSNQTARTITLEFTAAAQ